MIVSIATDTTVLGLVSLAGSRQVYELARIDATVTRSVADFRRVLSAPDSWKIRRSLVACVDRRAFPPRAPVLPPVLGRHVARPRARDPRHLSREAPRS